MALELTIHLSSCHWNWGSSFLLLLASGDTILTPVVLSGQFAKEFGIQLIHVDMQILVLDILPHGLVFGLGMGLMDNEAHGQDGKGVSQEAQVRYHFDLVLAVSVESFVEVGCHRPMNIVSGGTTICFFGS